ncbi:MAG: hypothetical protein JXN64_06250 [Spirochaetes bacterium]|nr:hypothetical protein [Spirochaetota bacterium]
MSLPYPNDPSLPSLPAPLFSDVDAARADHLRANNNLIWQDMEYLDSAQGHGDAINAADAKATPVDADMVGLMDSEDGNKLKQISLKQSLQWFPDNNTWEYVSADAPTYVFRINADMTAILSVGQKIKYTQDATTKYGIITAVGAYSGGYTNITIYGGGNTASPSYAMSTNAITNPYYATTWRPFDFPMNPDTWSYIVSCTPGSQINVTTSVIYNIQGNLINLPIGSWGLSYRGTFSIQGNVTGDLEMQCSLSTANNSISDDDFSFVKEGYAAQSYGFYFTAFTDKHILVASKTPYYLVERATMTGSSSVVLGIGPAKIKAVCQYL